MSSMPPSDYTAALEKTVLWDRFLPDLVFSRKPTVSAFFDGGLLSTENFPEELIRWSSSAFDNGDAVLAVCERDGGRLSIVDLFELSEKTLSGDCGSARRYWHSPDLDFFDKTCVLFNKGMDWMVYEEALEDFGVLALFTVHQTVSESPEWLQLMYYFFTKSEIESNLAKRPGSEHLDTLRREYLEQLLANY
jgi:hypothetical protein